MQIPFKSGNPRGAGKGHLMDVRQKLAEPLAETSLYFKTNARREKYYWSTIGRRLLSRTGFSFIILLK